VSEIAQLQIAYSRAVRVALLLTVYCRDRIPSIHSWIKDDDGGNGVLAVSGFHLINLTSFPFNFHHFHHRCEGTQLSC